MQDQDSSSISAGRRTVFTPFAVYIWAGLTLLAGFTGPFGTFAAYSFPVRLGYWAVIVGASILVARVVRLTIEQRFERRPAWQVELISVSILVPILTAIIWVLTPLLLSAKVEKLPQPEVMGGYVLFVSALVSGTRLLRRRLPKLIDHPPAAEKAPRLLERLPEERRGEVFRLTGRDHHVEVVTTAGTTAIRMRFSDAIAEMAPVPGHCAHRSHWVARAAISEVEREPGKVFLRLVNGDRVPVSRKYRPVLEAAGIV